MEKGYYFLLVMINITKHITTPNELQKQNKKHLRNRAGKKAMSMDRSMMNTKACKSEIAKKSQHVWCTDLYIHR